MTKMKRKSKCSEKPTSSSESISSLSSDGDVDATDLKPIKDYMSNRRELARQLFKSVKTEKVRMMLPQILKKVDLSELEEWCASELSGMSKKRILSILNGQSMVESSDTSDSDDSGPSLEIISDTEEWLTDDDVVKTEDGVSSTSRKTKVKKAKAKSKAKVQLTKNCDTNKGKVKPRLNQTENNKQRDIKVKREVEKEPNKDKEGDSLLDLLELEMRARAIRALIRKEEDIIPDTSTNKDLSVPYTSQKKSQNPISRDELRAKENCRKQLEKIITSKQATAGDDEDVVIVVQPTPTIELLSSESENEQCLPLANTKAQQRKQLELKSTLNDKNSDTVNAQEQSTAQVNETLTLTSSTEVQEIESRTLKIPSECSLEKRRKVSDLALKEKITLQNDACSIVDANSDPENGKMDLNEEKIENTFRKCRKKGHMTENFGTDMPEKNVGMSEKSKNEVRSVRRRLTSEDERLAEMEEIIDLDDYPDDMDDMENYDNCKNTMGSHGECTIGKETSVHAVGKLNLAETWATRYYQTDDVQSVIKESKMQSEIRKRLRERQRLAKLNNSPTTSTSNEAAADSSADKPEKKMTGSVQQYLALKRVNTASGVTNDGGRVTNESTDNMVIRSTFLQENKSINDSITMLATNDTSLNTKSSTPNNDSQIQTSLIEKEQSVIQPG